MWLGPGLRSWIDLELKGSKKAGRPPTQNEDEGNAKDCFGYPHRPMNIDWPNRETRL